MSAEEQPSIVERASLGVRGSRRRQLGVLIGFVLIAILGYNLSIWWPVSRALAEDGRNSGFGLHAYRTLLLHPNQITVDLVSLDSASPIDLNRGLFQTAAALHERSFEKVTLARKGKAIFVMSGDDFQELGREYANGQNPIYLVRTLPEKMHTPAGQAAFGTWTGGWLGVLGRQMEDATVFAEAWADGRTTGP